MTTKNVLTAHLLTVLGLGLLISGCQSDALAPESLPVTDAQSSLVIATTTDVLDLLNLPDVIGSASLTRNSSGASVNLSVDDLPAGVYTVWGAGFDAPENCATSPCGLPDLSNAAAEPSLSRVTGRVVGEDGPATFAGRLREGSTRDSLIGALENAETAELHFIVRTHGAPIPGLVDDQLHDVGGGCGINVCEDLAVAIFLP